jgi:CBS domain-containing protein
MKGMEMNELKVRDVMTHLVVTVRPEDYIVDAARLLLSNRVSGAPVVEEGRLVGIVSEADLIKVAMPPASQGSFSAPYPLMLLLARNAPNWEALNGSSVRDAMTKKVITIREDATIWEAASLIDRYRVRRLPVVDDEGFVVGILARSDLVRSMARANDARKAS